MPARSYMKIGLSIILALFAFQRAAASSLSSQTNPLDTTNAFARPCAMGSAFVGVADDASALFANPAGLSLLQRASLSANSNFWMADIFQETLLLGLPLGKAGGAGVAIGYLGYGTLEGRDEIGNSAPNYSAERWNVSASWGGELIPKVAFGFGFQTSQNSIQTTSFQDYGLNVGILARPAENFQLGAAINHLGLTGGVSTAWAINGGASYLFGLDSRQGFLAAVGGTVEPGANQYLQAGLEYSVESRFFFRAGYQLPLQNNQIQGLTGLTVGAGFALSEIQLDYAYLPYGEMGTSHRITLGYRFGSEPPNSSSNADDLSGFRPGNTPFTPGQAVTVGGQVFIFQNTVEGSAKNSPPAKEFVGASVPRPISEADAKGKSPLTLQFEDYPDNIAQGQDLEKAGKYREALDVYTDSIHKNPKDTWAWWALGNLYQRFNQKDSAVRCYEQVIQLDPKNHSMSEWLEKYKAAGK
ncbi:MAG TPA: tetratricopeptide repeat protein [bacterium]|nr:tetratricopeptide repeat protein [bacterium]